MFCDDNDREWLHEAQITVSELNHPTPFDAAQNTSELLGCKHTLQAHVQLFHTRTPKFFSAGLLSVSYSPSLWLPTPSATPCWTSLGSHGPAFQASPGLSGWHPFLLHQLHRSAWCHQANLLRMHSVLLYKLLIKNTRPKTGPLRDWIYVRWWSNFLTRWAFSPFQVTLLLCLWFLYPCVSIVVKSNLQNASRSMPWKICCLYFTQEFPNIIPQGDNTGQLNKLSQEKKKK